MSEVPKEVILNGIKYTLIEDESVITFNGLAYKRDYQRVLDRVLDIDSSLDIDSRKTDQLKSLLIQHPSINIEGVKYDFFKLSPGSNDTENHLNIKGVPKQLIVKDGAQYRLSKPNNHNASSTILVEEFTYSFTGILAPNAVEKSHLNANGFPKELIIRHGRQYRLVHPSPSVQESTSDISASAVEFVLDTNITPSAVESVLDTNITPSAVESVLDTNITPSSVESVLDTNITPSSVEYVLDINITPSAVESILDTNTTASAVKSDSSTNITTSSIQRTTKSPVQTLIGESRRKSWLDLSDKEDEEE